jgi:hypothetical protein
MAASGLLIAWDLTVLVASNNILRSLLPFAAAGSGFGLWWCDAGKPQVRCRYYERLPTTAVWAPPLHRQAVRSATADRQLLTGKDFAFVDDLATVEAIAKQIGEVFIAKSPVRICLAGQRTEARSNGCR